MWDFGGRRAPQSTFFAALTSVAPGIDDETDRTGARRGDLVSLLRDAGCEDVEESELQVSADYADFDEWWGPYTLGVAPAGKQLAALSEADRQRVRDRCRELLPPGPFTVTATAWGARGVVPG